MKNFKAVKYIIDQLWYVLDNSHKKKMTTVLIVIVIGAFLETLGVSTIVPFMNALLDPEKLMENKYVAFILNILHVHDTTMLIFLMGAFICLIYIVKNCFLIFSSWYQSRYQCNVQRELSVKMLKSYLKRPYSYFLNMNSAEILHGIGTDISGVYAIVDNIFRFIAESITTLLISIFILITDPFMALGVLLLALLSFGIVTSIFRRRLRDLGQKQRTYTIQKEMSAYQAITGIKEVLVMNREEAFINKFEKIFKKQTKTDISFYTMSACPTRIIEAVCISGLITVVCIRITLLGGDVAVFIPKLAMFAVAAFRVLPSVGRMTTYVNSIVYEKPRLVAAFDNLHEVAVYEEKTNEYLQKNIKNGEIDKNTKIEFHDKVEMKNIWWKYESGVDYVLKDLDLTIHKGESIALIGASGAGKTTLSDVLLGLLRPEKGNILMDGMDVISLREHWSKLVGYVPQTVFLSDDTLKNNIAFGLSEEEISEEKVWKALEQAQLTDFVRELPNGIDTLVGERGVKFSGGQRQRVAIARALYTNPEILILDEATSALDNETEKAVMESIDALHRQKTLIIVAHRLSTIKNCDTIYEIGNGVATKRNKEDVFGNK